MNWKKIAILLLVICALGYVIYSIGLTDILAILPKALKPGLLLFFILSYTNTTIRGYRWKTLLNDSMSVWEGFRLIFLTTFYNFVSPVRVGDLWRVNECKIFGLGRCTASIITEKVIDVSVLLILVMVSLSALGINAESQVTQGIIGSGIMIATAVVALHALKQKWFWELAGKFVKIEKGQHAHVKDFLKERTMMLKAFVMTIIIWTIDLFNFWYLANLITTIPIEMSSLALLIATLIGTSFITSVGVAQILVLIGALSLGLNAVDAAAIGILYGIVNIWIQIPIGFIIEMLGKKFKK